jgi:hypothetical protein
MMFCLAIVISYFAGSLKFTTILLIFGMLTSIGSVTTVLDETGYAIAIMCCAFACFLEFRPKQE